MSPFYESHGYPLVSASAKLSRIPCPANLPMSKQHPFELTPLRGCFALLARLELRPTQVRWLPFLFFRYLITEENPEGSCGAMWKSGKFLRIIIHIAVSGYER